MTPKWLRKRIYKKMLKKAEQQEIHLCREVRHYFPYQRIFTFPELWNRRDNLGRCLVPFTNHKERLEYLKEALKIVES